MGDSETSLSSELSQDMVMPVFVYNRTDGVFVDLQRLSVADGGFIRFVDRLFDSGARFSGLNYSLFLKLLYDADWLTETKSKTASVKLADSIVRFLPTRQALYRRVKLMSGDMRAEYMFEPVSIEETYKDPLYGDPGEDGIAPVTGYETKIRKVPTKLDFDELVTDMWLKGVKFGLHEDAIRKIIAKGETARMPIASHVDPTPSKDAEIVEVCTDLHRDNSPKILANGKVDLRVYKNRFPYVSKGTRMLKKVPRKLGKPGHKVSGVPIEPDIPKDLDLHSLSSLGTAVEQSKDGEYVVATMDGFIIIDTKSNSISISEKIEVKDGISVRTTGDLVLAVDEFVEHGEVQEGRIVEGKHMTFLSDVFGNVLSDAGNIRISGNLSGGMVETRGGNIVLDKRASRAVAIARQGELTATQCESSTLIAKVVHVAHAVNCEIVADEVFADVLEGCVVAGKVVKVRSAGERRGTETLVTMMVPDYTGITQRMDDCRKRLTEAQGAIALKESEIKALKSEPEFAKFLALHDKIESGAIKLTADQSTNWQKLVERHARSAQRLASLSSEAEGIPAKEIEEELAALETEQGAMGNGVSCAIDKITGHTVVQTMRMANGIDALGAMTGSDIRNALQIMDGRKARVCSKDDGSVDWKFVKSSAS